MLHWGFWKDPGDGVRTCGQSSFFREVDKFVDAVSFHSVPVSRLPDLVYETKQDIREIGLVTTIVGHVGDGRSPLFFSCALNECRWTTGNFHALLLFRNDEEMKIAREAVHRMVERAIRMEGTCRFYVLRDGHRATSLASPLTICFFTT